MADPNYDPVKRREYYERTKELKGRKPGTANTSSGDRSPSSSTSKPADAQKTSAARATRLKAKIKTLEKALAEAMAMLSEKRQAARQAEKESSDGKSTAKEKQSAKEYRDKNEQKLKEKRQQESKSSSGGSSASPSSSGKSLSSLSVEELNSRITKIKGALQDAKSQLSEATRQTSQLVHSAILSDPDVDEKFARFRLEGRTPSNDSRHY